MKELMPILIVGVLLISGISSLASIVHIDENYDLIIITPTSFSDDLQPLIEHKEQHAVATKSVTLEEIYNSEYFPVEGRDDAEQIKYFIRNAIESWNISYVMLVGGKEEMPVRYITILNLTGSSLYISDLYFADIYNANGSFCSWDSNNNSIFGEIDWDSGSIIDDVDLYPDVHLGRLLCSNQSEVSTVVSKIIDYENNAFNQPWFKNLVLCGGDDARSLLIESILPFLLHKTGRMALEGEFMGDRVAKYLDTFNATKIYASGLFRPRAKMLTINNINKAINDGAGFLLFVGHGSPSSAIKTNFPFCKHIWLPSYNGYPKSNVQSLNNGEKLPVAVFGGCNCGDFNNTSSPIAWEFVKHKNGGAIASFACTTGSIIALTSLCTETLTGHLTMGVFKSYSEGKYIAGEIWSDTIVNYLNDEDAISLGDAFSYLNWNHCLSNHQVIEEWTLFGDPSLKIGGYAE